VNQSIFRVVIVVVSDFYKERILRLLRVAAHVETGFVGFKLDGTICVASRILTYVGVILADRYRAVKDHFGYKSQICREHFLLLCWISYAISM